MSNPERERSARPTTTQRERFRFEEHASRTTRLRDDSDPGQGGRMRPPGRTAATTASHELPTAQRVATPAVTPRPGERAAAQERERPTVMRERLDIAAERDAGWAAGSPRNLQGEQWPRASYRPLPSPLGAPIELSGSNPALIVALVVVSIAVLWFLWGDETSSIVSRYANAPSLSAAVTQLAGVTPRAAGDHALEGPPSISPDQIDTILAGYGSPATGHGATFYQLGVEYGIDPAYAVAFFIHESSAGSNPAWAGMKPDGSTTHNVGNIICAGYSRCYGRFRDYPSWEDGIRDWYRLIRVEYIEGRGHRTVADVLPIYAPASDNNNPPGYTSAVEEMVNRWRAGELR